MVDESERIKRFVDDEFIVLMRVYTGITFIRENDSDVVFHRKDREIIKCEVSFNLRSLKNLKMVRYNYEEEKHSIATITQQKVHGSGAFQSK
jgi:hypothetical protein